jgi:hypothetical protein
MGKGLENLDLTGKEVKVLRTGTLRPCWRLEFIKLKKKVVE